MAITLLSPGVNIREIDISQPTTKTPTGVPACVISPTVKGPAFVPMMVTTLSDYVSVFGGVNANTPLGYLSAREWFSNTSVPLIQVRTLGAGDGLPRSTNGIVNRAGFVVGSQQISGAVGAIGDNIYANSGGVTGSTYMLGCFMSQSATATIFSDAGLQALGQNVAAPIVRGVLFAPSGVVLRLSSAAQVSDPPASSFVATESSFNGAFTGSVELGGGAQSFVMLLNGHKGTDLRYPNVITASFDPTAVNYFPSVFNTDPLKTEQAGHLLYGYFDVYPSFAVPTGSGVVEAASGSGGPLGTKEQIAFLVPSSGSAATHTSNVGSSTTPNFEGFEDRFGHAFSPWVISQGFGGKAQNLFRFHHLSDGEASNGDVKISITNIQPGSATNPYGNFTVLVRSLGDRDETGATSVLETFAGCTIDPTSPNYIGRKIGTINTFFNFDSDAASQKLVTVGDYANNSRFVRVEVAPLVDSGDIDPSAIPFGFRGPQHLVTQGSSSLYNVKNDDTSLAFPYFAAAAGGVPLFKASQPPVPMRLNLKKNTSSGVDPNLFWGVHFQSQVEAATPNNSSQFNSSLLSYNKYYTNLPGSTNVQMAVYDNTGAAPTADSGIVDADAFNNNLFSLEKVQVVTGSKNLPDTTAAALLNWQYVRGGSIPADDATKTRALTVDDLRDNAAVQRLAKFSFYLERGFDGVRIFNADTRYMKNTATAQEVVRADRGLINGPTTQGYLKSLNIIGDVNDVSIQLLTVPGIRTRFITDTAINTVENDRFDCFYIMDPQQYDPSGAEITGNTYENVSVSQTAQNFVDRGVNSSFAAAYFPDVNIALDSGVVYEKVPPSVAVLGVYGKNDAVAQPFNAPAGFTRGTLTHVSDFAVSLSQANSDTLYVARLNLLLSKTGVGPVVWGQKTLLNKDSLLNRVNVRRLLIAIRRDVRQVATRFLFEPARASTLAAFNAAVQPIMARYQAAGGVEKYKVVIDATTTTQADLDNKTLRGKIYLIPTTSLEFFTIDFFVTNRDNFVGG